MLIVRLYVENFVKLLYYKIGKNLSYTTVTVLLIFVNNNKKLINPKSSPILQKVCSV